MASQALYRRWRPMAFEEVIGQEHVTYTLRNALTSGRIGHAYLFAGPRGTGKTTMARLLAKAVNCLHEDLATRPCNTCAYCVAVNEGRFLDLIEIDAASHTGVDDVRELRDRIAFAPNEGQYKVYIIDEVHRFSGAAFDALLKTLEEPPAHAVFILATTEIHKVPQTIKSRCQRFDFRRIPLNQIVGRLQMILDSEGIQAEPAALELISRQATGSLRDAISLLDQLIAEPGEMLTLDLAQAILGTASSQTVRDLGAALIAGDTASGIALINQAIEQGIDARQLANQMVDHLRRLMLVQMGGHDLVALELMPDELAAVAEQAGQIPKRALLDALDAFTKAASDQHSGWQPQLPLEMAFVQSIESLYAPDHEVRSDAAPAAAPARPPALSVPSSQPEPVQQPGPTPSTAPAKDLVVPAEVHKRWPEVLRLARQSDLAVEALLKSGKLVSVEGDTVLYQMPSDLLLRKIGDPQNLELIERILQQVFDQPLRFRCKIQTAPGSSPSRDVEDLLASDSLISFAVNELGGSVKSVEDSEE